AALAASAFVALLLAVIVVGASTRGGSASSSEPSASGANLSAQQPRDPEVDDIVQVAQAKIDKGDFATAIDALTGVEKTAPDRADEHQLLERAYTGVRNAREAMREAGLWLTADPNASAESKLQ